MRKLFYSIRFRVFLVIITMAVILIVGHFTVMQPLLNEILLKQELQGVSLAANTTAQALDLKLDLAVRSLESLAKREEFRRMDQQQIAETLAVFDATKGKSPWPWESGSISRNP